MLSAAAFALALVFAAPAFSAAPQPAQRVDTANYSGRWYEIARMPNRLQRNCAEPFVDYTLEAGKLRAVQQCAAVNGRQGRVYRSSGRILDPGVNAKVRLSFLGFFAQEYWIVDHDTPAGWALVGDPSGRFVWVMSRRPTMPQALRDTAVARARALGYDVSRLEFAGARS
jgi:apolipoprotein D and lipocalin family protein